MPLAAVILAAGIWPACAGSSSTSTNLKSSSGGTGLSKNGGNGGTGVPASANLPIGSVRPTFKPAHAIAPPRAGVRPHTDLAAAQKRTDLSSRSLIKHSSLYKKIADRPGDPKLVGPFTPKIAPVDGGGSSFKAAPGLSATQAKSGFHPTNGGNDGGNRPMASLSSGGTSASLAMSAPSGATDSSRLPPQRGWLLAWLTNLLAATGTGAIAWWLWRQAPKGAHMILPVQQ